MHDESHLIAAAVALGARNVRGWSDAESTLASSLPEIDAAQVEWLRARIRAGQDPLGEALIGIRPRLERRKLGAVYTPSPLIDAMLGWAASRGVPERVVDPGSGSGRFILAAGARFPDASLIAVEVDPVAATITRGALAALGLANRAHVYLQDFRSLELPDGDGGTLYIGNPPYVRHHLLTSEWKQWLADEAAALGHRASRLAGLHVYFFLKVARMARVGDWGAFVTSAEWLDVNYGRLLRELLLNRLGGTSVHLVEPKAWPFAGVATTAAVTTFAVGSRPKSIHFGRVASVDRLGNLDGARPIRRERLQRESRWSNWVRTPRSLPSGFVELGELCRVHRGQVTGANRVWIAGPHSQGIPDSFLFPTVTRARELFATGRALTDPSSLRRVIDIPADLSVLDATPRRAVDRFLRTAQRMGADQGYIPQHRAAWWSVGLKEPAPILATYMARRPPAFVRNHAGARHINIAHGLYPREPLGDDVLNALLTYLRGTATTEHGRTYAGGLTKFEPREMERIPVPEPMQLESRVSG